MISREALRTEAASAAWTAGRSLPMEQALEEAEDTALESAKSPVGKPVVRRECGLPAIRQSSMMNTHDWSRRRSGVIPEKMEPDDGVRSSTAESRAPAADRTGVRSCARRLAQPAGNDR